MNRRGTITLVAFLMMFASFPAGKLRAADFSVGAMALYSSWDIELENDMGTLTSDRGFMYGPVFSAAFYDRWSIAGLFLYGKFKKPELDGESIGVTSRDRYDCDLTLNYAVSKIFKVFIGGKYVRFDFYQPTTDAKYTMYGPGLGVSATLKIIDALYFTVNVSYVYMVGEAELDSSTLDLTTHGVNASLALAYYIAPVDTTIYLGVRAQRLYEDREEQDNFKYHELLGVTLSATYSFSI